MNVHGAGNSQAWGNIRPEQGDMNAREARHAARETARPSAVDAAVADGEGGGARGVIRLLQEGHFKGVADVRLRINFFDELQAAGAANAARTLDSGVQGLIDTLGKTSEGPLAALLGTDDMTADDLTALADGFKQDAEEILAQFRSGETDLNGALDALEAALMSLAEPAVPAAEPAAEPSTEPAADQAADTIPEMAADIAAEAEAPVENTEDLSTTITAAAQDQEGIESTDQPADTPGPSAYDLLRTELTKLMADLRKSVTDTQALPPLSPPRGNGQAYSKFLEIYNTLIGGGVTEPATGAAAEPVAEPLDVLV
ncbi:MAG TPA: hypothetical protein DGF30_01000 [Desulfomicrobium sp.]|nr:hypothetical protein [Desulfomicrobium sp.]